MSSPLTFRGIVFSLYCLIVLLCTAVSLYAADPQYIPLTPEQRKIATHTTQRLMYSLAGEWQRQVPLEESEWKNVTLPFSETATGEVHYRRTFTITQQLINHHEWHLHFLGSNYKTQVYINGQYLQSHAGGSTQFQVRVPDQYLRDGNNTIELIVSNELDATTTIPLRRKPHEAKVFGGIFRELYIVGTSEVFFSTVDIKTIFDTTPTSGRIEVTASISSGALKNLLLLEGDTVAATQKNPTLLKTSIEIVADVYEDSSVVAKAVPVVLDILPNRSVQVKLTLPFSSLKMWSPASPYLYTFVARIRRNGRVLDDFTFPLGLCNVQKTLISDKPTLLLNGEPITFKGVDYIEDSEVNRQTPTMAEYEKDIIAIKTLGANVVRFRYSTPHPYFSYLCDKYGLFILIELPLSGAPASVLGKENFIVTAQLAIREAMLSYDANVSTLAWSICDLAQEGTPELATYTQRLREVIRPISTKMLFKSVAAGAPTLDVEGFDFIIFDMHLEQPQNFRAEALRLAALAKQTVVMYCFGKAINPENHNGYSDPLSMEAQAKLLRNYYRTLQENSISTNVIITSFCDYLAERPALNVNNSDRYVMTSGLLSRTRDARVSYTMVKALFNDEKEPVLETGNYLPESPTFYTVVSILLLIAFFVLVNSNRRFREDVLRALLRPYNFYTDIRDQRILSNAGTLTLALIVSATVGLLVSSMLYFIRFNFLLDYTLTHFIGSDTIKDALNTIIWIPWASFATGTLVFLIMLAMTTLLVRIGSFFIRARILMSDALVISVWACLPLVFLLVLTMGLYKVMTGIVYAQVAFALIVGAFVWCIYRALRGTAIIYDVRSSRVYVIGVSLLVLIAAIVALIYNTQYATFAYGQYFFATLWR